MVLVVGTAKMRPRARLISVIGDQLISDEPVALVELVKNTYDADATEVTVEFGCNRVGDPVSISVTDNGTGMDLETVLHGWFEPGTVNKIRSTVSPRGRPYQGAKGIGRFAAARLARSMLLETKKEGTQEGVLVLLEWGKFDEESYLDDINCEYETYEASEKEHGTRLFLDGLRKQWTDGDYEALYSRLSRLISPFGEVRDFQVHLQIPLHQELSGLVSPPEITLTPKYSLMGELDNTGHFSGSIFEDGVEKKVFRGTKVGGTRATPLCGGFGVEIRAWDRDPEGLEPFSKRFGLSTSQIRKILNAYSGVSIYRGGFRVHAYGQKGNDWLNLDLRSRQNPPKNLANNQIIGSIRITRSNNPLLEDRSTREGMVLNDAHEALEDWFKEILSLLEDYRYSVRPRKDRSTSSDPLFEVFDLHPIVKRAESELGVDHPFLKYVAETQRQVEEGVERLQATFSSILMMAGLGHLVDIVIHEIGAPLGRISRQLMMLEGQLKKAGLLAEVNDSITSIRSSLEQLHNLRQRLDPQTPAKRGRATTFHVADAVQACLDLFESLLRKQGIQCDVTVPSDLVVTMSRSSLEQVLVNLIDNSIYWLIRHKGVGQGGRISIQVLRLDHGFSLTVGDDGPGVAEEDRPRIFESYFTRKPTGMGLGLYICRLVIEPYGRLTLRDNGSSSGACFEAIYERGVGM